MGNVSHSLAEAYTDKFSVLSCNEQHSIYHLREKASGKLLIFKTISSNDDRMTDNLVKIYEKRKSLSHDNIVCLRGIDIMNVDYYIKTKKTPSRYETLESSGGVLYECLERTAYDQRLIKSRERKPFSNSELLNVLRSSVAGMAYLQSKNIQHGSVSSKAIFIGKNGSVKICDPFISQVESNYDIFLNGNKSTYLSPNQLASVKNGEKLAFHNGYKSDVFCLGLVMIELALLEGQQDLYDRQCLDESTLLQRISSLYQNFGMWISSILQRMLIVNESSRPDWLQLEKQLQEYQKCTKSLSDFKTSRQKQQTDTIKPHIEQVKSRLKLGEFRQKLTKLVNQTPVDRGNTEHSSARVNNQSLNIISHSKNSMRINSPQVQVKANHKRHFSHTDVPISKLLSPQGLSQNKYTMGGIPKLAISIRQISQYSQSKCIQDRISMESQQTTKGAIIIPIIPMEISVNDKPLPSQHPKQYYKIKTTLDENLIEHTARHSASSLFSNSVVDDQTSRRSKFAFRNNYREVEMSPELSKTDNKYMVSNKMVMNSPRMVHVKEIYKQGARYEGWKVRGMREGQGKFYYKDGGMYDGEWHLNKMHGKGILYYPSGQVAYDGMWNEDHFHGQGKVYNEKPLTTKKYHYSDFSDVQDYWVSYDGAFYQDLKDGYGVLKLSSGQQYQGMFKKDQVHGQGIFRSKTTTIRALWSYNKLVKVL